MENSLENPLDIASEHGRNIAGEMGRETFMELELSYATTLLNKTRFTDNPLIRVVQHILLYRDQGYLKSTSIDEFAKAIPDDYRVANVTSSSTEALFGSISDNGKHIIPPLFVDVEIARVDELLSFIGTSNQMKDKVNTLNGIMEGATITRHLLKLSQEEFSSAKVDKLAEQGILYDPHKGQLSFRSDVCFWAATRPIDNRTYTYLRASGHLYRYHVLLNEVSDEESRRFFTEDIKPDLNLREKLKQLNSRLSKISIKELKTPQKTIMDRIFAGLQDIIQDEFRTEKKRLAEVIDLRTRGDITREIAAHAFLRTATEKDFHNIDKIEYTADDEEFILKRLPHFIEFKINPVFVEDYSQPRKKKKRPKEEVKELVLTFLKDGKVRQRMDIDKYVNETTKVSTATISNTLKDMTNTSICSPKHGSYKLRDCQKCENKCNEDIWEIAP